jgi:hypothetical protein
MHATTLSTTRRVRADEARLQAIVAWERGLRTRRHVSDAVREAAYDKAVDGLLKDRTLGRDPRAVRGLGERCLSWARADDLRARLTPSGELRPTPRAAAQLDADRQAERSPAPEEIAHWRGQFRELCRRADSAGDLTRDVVSAYLRGGDPTEVAARHGVGRSAVHQAKARFVARNLELGR